MSLLEDLSIMCTKLLKNNLIARVTPHPRASILSKFDPYAHCLYLIDTAGRKIENCWLLKQKIYDLINIGVITI